MEAESTSGDVRGRCNLGAPGLQCGGVMNAGRGATVRTHAVHPKLSVRGRLLGVPDLRCAFPQLVKDSWLGRRCRVQLCASMHFGVPVILA